MLNKISRVRQRKEFRRIYQRGRRVNGEHIALQYLRRLDEELPARWAVVVSTKVAKRAVRRNRLRRRLQGHIKKVEVRVKPGVDIVVIVRADFFSVSNDVIENQLLELIKRAHLLKA